MSPSRAPPDTHVALLRGINVGGRNRLPMATLRGLFESAGAADVRTYVQSGNVVFRTDGTDAVELVAAVRAQLDRELGLDAPMTTRTPAELAEVVAGNPFLADDQVLDPKHLHVVFLADRPTDEQLTALDPERSPPDTFHVADSGRELYLHCPRGLARTKLTNAWFDRVLGTVSTARNWRTTNKLLAMCLDT